MLGCSHSHDNKITLISDNSSVRLKRRSKRFIYKGLQLLNVTCPGLIQSSYHYNNIYAHLLAIDILSIYDILYTSIERIQKKVAAPQGCGLWCTQFVNEHTRSQGQRNNIAAAYVPNVSTSVTYHLNPVANSHQVTLEKANLVRH